MIKWTLVVFLFIVAALLAITSITGIGSFVKAVIFNGDSPAGLDTLLGSIICGIMATGVFIVATGIKDEF